MTLREIIEQFLIARETDGKSPATLKWYRWQLEAVLDGIGDLPLTEVTVTALRTFFNAAGHAKTHYSGGMQMPGPVAKETVNGRKRALRALFKWLVREGLINPAQNPMRNITVPYLKQGEIKAISLDAWGKLLEATNTQRDQVAKRNRALLAFLIDSGCRAGGVTRLKPDDLFLDRLFAVVCEKGSKIRSVPFTAYTADLLHVWLVVRPKSEAVFCGLGPKNHGRALTVSGLAQIFKRLKKTAGIDTRCNPHAFRHAFARECALNGCDIATISRLMGHDSINITLEYYARFTFAEDAARHKQASPLRDFNK